MFDYTAWWEAWFEACCAVNKAWLDICFAVTDYPGARAAKKDSEK
ncbi:MAG: hypothetical protein Q8Q36_03180 [bacterium]|nr:hypothetical protein [bacterium]